MTISELAKEAGVSIATVSRFLNNGPVKEETRKKLEALVLKQNFVPSKISKEIINGQGKSIAVLTHSFSNLYTAEFSEAVVNLCGDRKMTCYTGCCSGVESEYNYLLDFVSRKINGVILHEPKDGEAQLKLYERIAGRMPLVWIHSIPIDIEVNSISVNQEKGMKLAMEYLMGLGHKKIAYVTGEKGYSYTLKQTLWQEELTKAGFAPAPGDLITVERTDFIDGIKTTKEAVSKYLAAGNRPTAIFCANDIMAMGTINALTAAGLRVPDDVSIMSHDNTVLADSMNLTCVDMKIKSVAIAAMDLLDYAMNGSDKTPRHITIIPELIIRDSCRQLK